MFSFKGITITGIVFSSVAILASLGTEGFYAWKVYELGHECNITAEDYQPDVCRYDDLEVRSYVGLAEGIFATAVSIVLLIGFALPAIALVWVWVIWALGIASYNAYCISDYRYNIIKLTNETSIPWDTLVEEDYGIFFIVVMTSVIWYGTVLLIVIPLAAYLTNIYNNGNTDSYSFEHYDNDGFDMGTIARGEEEA